MLKNFYIKEYTDCQLRLGLLKWLICLIPSHGRPLETNHILNLFERSLYSELNGKTLIEKHYKDATRRGMSPHLGIIVIKKKQVKKTMKATKDILDWAVTIGFLSQPIKRGGYAITKDGFNFQKLIGADEQYLKEIESQVKNPFILTSIERRFLFIQEISRDSVLLPLIVHISKNYNKKTNFYRTNEDVKKLVRLLIISFEDLHTVLSFERRLLDAKNICEHIWLLEKSIDEVGVSEKSIKPREIRNLSRKNIQHKKDKISSSKLKTAKHRLTPRLEHLTDFEYLSPAEKELKSAKTVSNPYCWRLSSKGDIASKFIQKLNPVELYKNTQFFPKINNFIYSHSMHFFKETEKIEVSELGINTEDDKKNILKYFCWAYKKCRMQYGYTQFYGIGIVAALYALENNHLIELIDIYNFLIKVVKKDTYLSANIRFAGKSNLESMHIKISDSFLKEQSEL